VRLPIPGLTSSPNIGAHPRREGCLMTAEQGQYGKIAWRRSTASNAGDGCIEVAVDGSFVLVRDSRNRQGGTLKMTSERWSEFLRLIGAASDQRSGGAHSDR
jgi:hypothetical protein